MENEDIGGAGEFFDEYINLDSVGKSSGIMSVPATPGGPGSPSINLQSVGSRSYSDEGEESESDSDESEAFDTSVFWRPESIKAMAESVGGDLDEDGCAMLSHAVINKLRHVTLLAMQYSRHNKAVGIREIDFTNAANIVEPKAPVSGVSTKLPDYVDTGDFCIELEGPEIELRTWKRQCRKQRENYETVDDRVLSTAMVQHHDSLATAFYGKEKEVLAQISAANHGVQMVGAAATIAAPAPSNGNGVDARTGSRLRTSKRTRAGNTSKDGPEAKKSKTRGRGSNGTARTRAAQKDLVTEEESESDESSDEEDFVRVKPKPQVRHVVLSDELAGATGNTYEAEDFSTPGSVPKEWVEYVQSFITAFHDKTEVVPFAIKSRTPIETDETSTCACTDYDLILKDAKTNSLFPVLHVLCDFFQNYIKKTRRKKVEIQLRKITSLFDSILRCPVRCKVYHLEPMLSTLKDMLVLPARPDVISTVCTTLFKIADYSDHPYNLEIIKWITFYINAALDAGTKVNWNTVSPETCIKISAALRLCCGYLLRGLRLQQTRIWVDQVTKMISDQQASGFDEALPKKSMRVSSKLALQESILDFIHLYLRFSAKTGLSIDMLNATEKLKGLLGEKILFPIAQMSNAVSPNSTHSLAFMYSVGTTARSRRRPTRKKAVFVDPKTKTIRKLVLPQRSPES